MENIKMLIAILASLTVLLIMVLLHSFNENVFIRDAEEIITEARNHVISMDNLTNNKQVYQIVNLDGDSARFRNSVSIPFKDILLTESREKLRASGKDIFLYSQNVSTSAKAWVILNQLNFERIFILKDSPTLEVLKYKFQPDSAIKLESN